MSDPELPPGVEHSERLVRLYGHWPDFHDAEVIRVVLRRQNPVPPTLELTIRLDAGWCEPSPGRAVVTLLFHDVEGVELWGFNEQNVLFDLVIDAVETVETVEQEGRALRVALPTSYGLGGTFTCSRLSVASAEVEAL